ncbi:MAG: sulfatase-like hydrolase/transferase, partial [Planctomycetota bacterium]
EEQPFFTVISYPDPHGPNTVRPPYDHRFDDLPFQPPRTFQRKDRPSTPRWLGSSQKHDVFRGDDMSKYFGMVQCIDDNIGRLMAQLRETGQLDNTLILFTSDHGDLCYEHDRLNKGNPYEGSARVPLIVRMPRLIKGGEYYVRPVGTVDITPTIMGFLDLPSNPDDHGRDLSAELADASVTRETDPAAPVTFLRSGGLLSGWVAAIDDRYKLVLSMNDVPWLFDRVRDPDELVNWFGRPETNEVSRRLGRALQQYHQRFADPAFDQAPIANSLAKVIRAGIAMEGNATTEADKKAVSTFESNWSGSRRWIGPNWWANPMQDWILRKGTAIVPAAADRTLCLLTSELKGDAGTFEAKVSIDLKGDSFPATAAVGFRLGRRGGIDDHRHALIHSTDWVDAVIRSDGRLSLENHRKDAPSEPATLSEEGLSFSGGPITLTLSGRTTEDGIFLTLTAEQDGQTVTTDRTFQLDEIRGGFSLLADGPSRKSGSETSPSFGFRDFQLKGDLLTRHADRAFGPIAWTQYTLSEDRLRLQAQFVPLGERVNHEAELWIDENAKGDGSGWVKLDTQPIDSLSRTATFTIDDWQSNRETPYEVRFKWRGELFAWNGRIRREPGGDAPFKLACFSCDNGYLFPIPAMVSQVKSQDPDMVFFAGDQIYESYGGFGVDRSAETKPAMIDYLRKYYQFGWTWRDVLRDRPSVILPDDHDVFQGNLWGQGGRVLPPSEQKNAWTLGGYLMPGDWVRAIERTQVGHLPDPAVEMTLPIGIKPYFTQLTYGGIGFAILEDRKFKTGPLSMPEAERKD